LRKRTPTRPVPKQVHVAQDVGLDRNSIAVVGRDGVLVFDSNGTPAAAAAVLTRIRTLTDRPVKYLVNSHWHRDHWYGAEVYKKAFPEIEIITHENTREMVPTRTFKIGSISILAGVRSRSFITSGRSRRVMRSCTSRTRRS
jgi:glyoxylase-like metal-dependent hydrolase (beta-lactamase superfamily II)